MGPTGERGIKGDKGDKGDRGLTGPQGSPGVNATTTAVATQSANGLMSKEDKIRLDGMGGGGDVTKGSVERVLTGNIATHTHDPVEGGGMMTDVWDGVAVSTRLSGSGTKSDPWLVGSCADFLHMNIDGAKYGYDISLDHPGDETVPSYFLKITCNLDFNDHGYSYPALTTNDNNDPVYKRSALSYAEIDGQGAMIMGMRLGNGFSPFLNLYCCHVHDLGIKGCVFEHDAAVVRDAPYSIFGGNSEGSWGNFTYDCSCEATFKVKGGLTVTGEVMINIIGVIGIDVMNGRAGAYYGNNTFTNEVVIASGGVVIAYVPVMPGIYGIGSWPELAPGVKAYDLTRSTGAFERGGFIVCMADAGFGAPVYYNSDTTAVIPTDEAPVTCIGKTTAELRSPEFLTLLNGGTDTFVADTGNVNGGFPVLKSIRGEAVYYDGYVRKSEFDRVVAELRALITSRS